MRRFLIMFIVLLAAAPAGAGEYWYGIEISGVTCGYSKIKTSTIERDG